MICERCSEQLMDDGSCYKHGCHSGVSDGDSFLHRFLLVIFTLAFAGLILCANLSIVDATVERTDMFQSCIEKTGAHPINTIWLGSIPWIQSTVHPSMISSMLSLEGEHLDWNSDTGVDYPVLQKAYGINTIGMTLSDGSIVRFIVDGEANGRFYGWLTNSTQFYGADYNPQPQPHVRCEFWSVSSDDIFNLYDVFVSLTRYERFYYEAR